MRANDSPLQGWVPASRTLPPARSLPFPSPAKGPHSSADRGRADQGRADPSRADRSRVARGRVSVGLGGRGRLRPASLRRSQPPSPRAGIGLIRWPGSRLGTGPARRVRLSLARHRRPLAVLLAITALWATIRAAAPPPPPTVAVPVASRDLPAGQTLTAADVRIVRWPADLAPSRRTRLDATQGRTTATAIASGEAITSMRLLGPGLLTGQPAGSVAVTVRLADPASAAPVRAGDRVDILAAPAASAAWDAMPAPAPNPAPTPAPVRGGVSADPLDGGAGRLAAGALVLAKPAAVSPDSGGGSDGASSALGSAAGVGDSFSSAGDASSPGVLVLSVDPATATRLAGAAGSRPLSVVLLASG